MIVELERINTGAAVEVAAGAMAVRGAVAEWVV